MNVWVGVLVIVQSLLSEISQSQIRIPAIIHENTDVCFSQDSLDAAHSNFTAIVSVKLMSDVCGATSDWRRVGYLDMSDPSQSCPPGLALKYYSPGLRSCGRATNLTFGCWSTLYDTGGSQYSRVCGRVRGYQFGDTSAFQTAHVGIDNNYVDGVSLTHGPSGRCNHIWTFAAQLSDIDTNRNYDHKCPCVTPLARQPPAFVGDHYFCESGLSTEWMMSHKFYPDDPLWDGLNCTENSCCQPPYFTMTLPASTSDDIELRICSNMIGAFADSPIDQVELYVQ